MVALIMAGAAVTPAQNETPVIKGGIVNGKATKLPTPEYPEELRIAGIGGRVFIRVVIEEAGNVSSAEHYIDTDATKPSNAEPPHPLLIEAARKAALKAEFPPSVSNDVSARIPVVLVYNFSKELPVKNSQVAKQDPTETMIKGGVLNGRARSLPAPEYPASAKAVRAAGAVTVEIIVDEEGSVESAKAVSGHPLLRAAAVAAARKAKFGSSPVNSKPAKTSGVLIYKFVAKEDPEGPGDYEGPVRVQSPASRVLNHRAISLPAPAYPPAGKAVRASGTVTVEVVIGLAGSVESARAISGHPLLRASSVAAARKAKFSPTYHEGMPVKISGVLVYTFALPN